MAIATRDARYYRTDIYVNIGIGRYEKLCRYVGLLDYDKNHNHDYFGQYCNHDYLTRLLAGRITHFFFNANLNIQLTAYYRNWIIKCKIKQRSLHCKN